MAPHIRKMIVSGDHLNSNPGPPWTVLWETTVRSDGHWSIARTNSEAAALECATHFLKLGFVVHAIKDPTGSVVMDGQSIASRFGGAYHGAQPVVAPRRSMASAEHAAANILHGFADGREAVPGLMVSAATLHARLSALALSPVEFYRAIDFAADRGWLLVKDDILSLTQAGYAIASSSTLPKSRP